MWWQRVRLSREFIQGTAFEKAWNLLGLTDLDLRRLQHDLLQNPKTGVVMRGTGRLRKMRFSFEHQGKSGRNIPFDGGIRMSEMFDILNDALDEAIADAKAKQKFLKRETVSIHIEPPAVCSAEDIKKIRHGTGLTQGMFARWFGVSPRTVEAWEAGRNTPSGPSNRLLGLLREHRLFWETE